MGPALAIVLLLVGMAAAGLLLAGVRAIAPLLALAAFVLAAVAFVAGRLFGFGSLGFVMGCLICAGAFTVAGAIGENEQQD